jgi:hypothetical protein
MNLSIKNSDTEFSLDGYISTDNDQVTAAIFTTFVPGANGDVCLGAYYGYAGGGDNDGGFFSKRIHNGGFIGRHQDHVRLVDAFPAGDRRAVEHDAVGERILADEFRRHGQVLPLATGVGKAQINEVYFVVLQGFQDVRWGLAIQ